MFLSDNQNIKEVLLFPAMKPEGEFYCCLLKTWRAVGYDDTQILRLNSRDVKIMTTIP